MYIANGMELANKELNTVRTVASDGSLLRDHILEASYRYNI